MDIVVEYWHRSRWPTFRIDIRRSRRNQVPLCRSRLQAPGHRPPVACPTCDPFEGNALSRGRAKHEHLYLLARDAIDFVPAMSGNYLPDDGVDVVTVSYAVVGKTFDVDLRDGNCCGGTIFTFRRKGQ